MFGTIHYIHSMSCDSLHAVQSILWAGGKGGHEPSYKQLCCHRYMPTTTTVSLHSTVQVSCMQIYTCTTKCSWRFSCRAYSTARTDHITRRSRMIHRILHKMFMICKRNAACSTIFFQRPESAVNAQYTCVLSPSLYRTTNIILLCWHTLNEVFDQTTWRFLGHQPCPSTDQQSSVETQS